MDESIFFDNFKIKASETDVHKRIKIPNLLGYMQEAAWTNATKLGFSTYDMLEHHITWVLNRMFIEFTELPTYPQAIEVETWPSGMDKYFTYRDFRVFDEKSKLLVKATSNWLILDINTRKLIAIPEHVKEARFPVDRNGMDKIKGKCSYETERTESEFPIKVSWFDLDINQHVNNTKYFQWILDPLKPEFLEGRKIKSLDITFKAEAGYGDNLLAKSYSISKDSFAHHITEVSSGKVLVVAKSVFL